MNKKSYGRKVKKQVGRLLTETNRDSALAKLKEIPDEQLVGHLFSHFYHRDELIKFRSITAMGLLCARIAEKNMEQARIVLRRIMWNLNDESGGIGWGSPEAMGEILCQNNRLAMEFKSILFSYLDPDGNFLEHEMLQRGVIWGIGSYLSAFPIDLTEKTKGLFLGYLHSPDAVKIGYAIRALVNANNFDCRLVPESIFSDQSQIDIFSGWNFYRTKISDMALTCEQQGRFA